MHILKTLRTKKEWTQKDVAQLLGIDRTTYAKYESGSSEPSFEMLKKLSDVYNVPADTLLGWSHSSGKSGSQIIPVLGDVAAGIPIEAVTDIVDYEEIDAAMAATGEHFGLRIKGSSMEPRMVEGDVVIVRKQDTAETGDTVVVLVNGDSATVKKIKFTPAGIYLIPTNPSHEVQFYSPQDVEQLPVRVIGKVVELRAKY